MPPDLQQYLEKQGERLLAAEQVIRLLVGMFALDQRGTVEANLRDWRIRMQELAASGKNNPALERAVKLLEDALAWPVDAPQGLRPAKS